MPAACPGRREGLSAPLQGPWACPGFAPFATMALVEGDDDRDDGANGLGRLVPTPEARMSALSLVDGVGRLSDRSRATPWASLSGRVSFSSSWVGLAQLSSLHHLDGEPGELVLGDDSAGRSGRRGRWSRSPGARCRPRRAGASARRHPDLAVAWRSLRRRSPPPLPKRATSGEDAVSAAG